MTSPGHPRPPQPLPTTRDLLQCCTAVHAAKLHTTGQWTPGDADQILGVLITASGIKQYRSLCRRCSQRSGSIPHWIVEGTWADLGLRPAWHDDTSNSGPTCAYLDCKSPAEWHHTAPRNTFGPDADRWPLVPLCPAHHRGWHQRMDGYRWHTPGAWAEDGTWEGSALL